MVIETEAFALQTRKYGETSKILQLFTKEYGLLSVLQKGAEQITKSKTTRFSPEPLNYIYVSIYKNRVSDLHILKTAEIVELTSSINRDYYSITSGMVVAEFVNKTQENECPNKELFQMLKAYLLYLNKHTDMAFYLCCRFLCRLSEQMGFGVPKDIYDADLRLITEPQNFCDVVLHFEKFFSQCLEKPISIKTLSLFLNECN